MSTNGKAVLVTGGAGYIGSHVVLELLTLDFDVVVLDNLSNSSRESLNRVEALTNKKVTFHEADIRDRDAITKVFETHGGFQVVMNFAGLKAVGESTTMPLEYYQNNVTGTVTLLQVMESFNCFSFIFSSSATVYGSAPTPYSEDAQTGVGITNPYGYTKHVVEEVLRNLSAAPRETKVWNIVILRYFNPIGAHVSGRIGEDPQGIPNNLMPYVSQVCVGRREKLTVHGNDYDTVDGTGVRDYIHVVDLAKGHVAALKKIQDSDPECRVYNLGCGKGYSVLEVVKAMEATTGKTIPYTIGPRRPGDLAEAYAVPTKADVELNWKTEKNLSDMCEDTWRWQSGNPNGYAESAEE